MYNLENEIAKFGRLCWYTDCEQSFSLDVVLSILKDFVHCKVSATDMFIDLGLKPSKGLCPLELERFKEELRNPASDP